MSLFGGGGGKVMQHELSQIELHGGTKQLDSQMVFPRCYANPVWISVRRGADGKKNVAMLCFNVYCDVRFT